MNNVLFVVENDYFPRDARVYNEALSLSNKGYKVFVLAPRNNGKKERFYEIVENKIFCYRHPHYEAKSIKGLLFEYFIPFLFYLFFVPALVFLIRIKIIHVANPPDFILICFFWLKLFGVKFIYDIHDLSVETFNGKVTNRNRISTIVTKILKSTEIISIRLADIIISTNNSIKEIIRNEFQDKKVVTVRNSNRIQFNSIADIDKKANKDLILGYFGVISDDYASGFENLALIGKYLAEKNIKFTFDVIGDGRGLEKLRKLVKEFHLEKHYIFRGFIDIPEAFNYIKQFDFGILPWPDIPKNNLHTAMKLMDYMCCGVPVCSLKLKEQIFSTNGIGIHTDSFEEMVDLMIRIYTDKIKYENLRKRTLEHFNLNISWEKQEIELLNSYKELLEENQK